MEHPHLEVVGSSLPMITIFPCVNFKTELPKSPVKLGFELLSSSQNVCNSHVAKLESSSNNTFQFRVKFEFESSSSKLKLI